MDLRSQWYALSDSQEMALRLHSSTTLGENMEGDLVFSAKGACHAARIKVIAEQLWLAPIIGSVVVDGVAVDDKTELQQYSQVSIGGLHMHIGRAVSDFAPEMTTTQTLVAVDETVTETSIPILEDRVEEIVLQEVGFQKPVDEPSRIGALPTDRNRSVFGRWSWKILKRKGAAFSSLAILATFAMTTFWLAPKLATNAGANAEASPFTRTELDPVAANHRIRPNRVADEPTPNPSAPDNGDNGIDKSEDQLRALVSITEHGEVSTANNNRILTLATALQASAHIDAVGRQLDIWQSRLQETAKSKQRLQMTSAVNDVEDDIGNVKTRHASARVVEVDLETKPTRTREQIAELNKRAYEHLQSGRIYEPGREGLVSTAQKILALDSTNEHGKRWLRKGVDGIVAQARSAAAVGSEFEARSLVEDALALDPNHPEAKLLWRARLVVSQ